MSSPRVSVIMPVYNTAAYLGEAIQSILDQSYGDFEFIIINDGSTDHSEQIINSFNDPRIIYLNNEENQGLVYTLNRGVNLASGEWIARMDGDDISLPIRFEEQMQYLHDHPYVDVLATTVQLIDEQGADAGIWVDDQSAILPEQILAHLPVNNCIAHPTVMVRAEILKKFKYLEEQAQAEDYDLWLRMASRGYVIHKLNETLVKHRISRTSFTRSRQQNVFSKLAITKFRFAKKAWRSGNRGSFVFKTYCYACLDEIKAWMKPIKQKL
jgi:glycosyltransferase involved in cell wall biosynthesis